MSYLIAEIGSNHDGDIDRAHALLKAAAESGADAVKFQAYHADLLVCGEAEALPQARKAGFVRQVDRFRSLEFTQDQWEGLIGHAAEVGTDFVVSVFDEVWLKFFGKHPGVAALKIASGDITHFRLLRAIAEYTKPKLLSTGLSFLSEIDHAVHILGRDTVVMHCVSAYPTPPEHANLQVIRSMLSKYPEVGYSDHTQGITACIAAAAMGASVIEKHFTDDATRTDGDHSCSLTPHTLSELMVHLRTLALMRGDDKPARIESIEQRRLMRRGPYAAKPIEHGQPISEGDVHWLRPVVPQEHCVGQRASKNFAAGEPLRQHGGVR